MSATAVGLLLLLLAVSGLYLRTAHELDTVRETKTELRAERDDLADANEQLRQRVRELEGDALTIPETWTLNEEQAQ